MGNRVLRIGHPADPPSATVSWTAPILDSEGNAVPEAGDDALYAYRVAWYTGGYFVNSTRVYHPTVTAKIYDLPPATYEFFVTAITYDGEESDPVSIGTKVVS